MPTYMAAKLKIMTTRIFVLSGILSDHTINPVVTDLPRDFYDVLGVQASNYIRQFGEFYFDYFKYDPLKKGRK